MDEDRVNDAERVDLWRDGDGFALVFTGPEVREVRRYGKRELADLIDGGEPSLSDTDRVIAYFEARIADMAHAPARTPPELGGVAAWILMVP